MLSGDAGQRRVHDLAGAAGMKAASSCAAGIPSATPSVRAAETCVCVGRDVAARRRRRPSPSRWRDAYARPARPAVATPAVTPGVTFLPIITITAWLP